jgi:hypothetical protein
LTLPSRCARCSGSKASPTGLKLSQQVRSEPACVPVTEGMEPGVARVQAVRLNPEIRIVVVRKDNLLSRRREKPTWCTKRKAAVPSCAMASRRGHHRGLRTGHAPTGVARELGRACCLPATNCRFEGCRLTQSPGVDTRLPVTQRAFRGDTNQWEATGYRLASDERSDRDGRTGSLSLE